MQNKLMIIYTRTLNNCRFYEEQKDTPHLIAEIGCLRGLAYALGATGVNGLDLPGLKYYIGISNKLLGK